MAWHSSGRTNDELINNLFTNNLITSPRVRDAMLKVDRAHYAPTAPYDDSPQPIGHHATISAPHMHAAAASALLPFLHPASRVLDIGSGSGYLTAVLAELVHATPDSTGTVIGVEHVAALRDLGARNMAKSARGRSLLDDGKVRFVLGDGRKGWREEGHLAEGYDAIHVGAAAVELHAELVKQLRAPGRLFIPVEEPVGRTQWIWVVDKDEEGKVTKERTLGVMYVPLTDAPVER